LDKDILNEDTALTGFKDIFKSTTNIIEKEKVIEIPITELFSFKNHPFKVREDDAMMELVESIKMNGA